MSPVPPFFVLQVFPFQYPSAGGWSSGKASAGTRTSILALTTCANPHTTRHVTKLVTKLVTKSVTKSVTKHVTKHVTKGVTKFVTKLVTKGDVTRQQQGSKGCAARGI